MDGSQGWAITLIMLALWLMSNLLKSCKECVKHSENFRIDHPTETLFPLFSAEGKKLWVSEWDYENIMSSNDLHEDYIFLGRDLDMMLT